MDDNPEIIRFQTGGPRDIGVSGNPNRQNVHERFAEDALRLSVMTPSDDIRQTQERARTRFSMRKKSKPPMRNACRRSIWGGENWAIASAAHSLDCSPGSKKLSSVPSYGRDINAAWEIVDFLVRRGIRTHIESKVLGGPLQTYAVEIGNHEAPISRSMYVSPAIALCLAFDLARKAVLDKPLL